MRGISTKSGKHLNIQLVMFHISFCVQKNNLFVRLKEFEPYFLLNQSMWKHSINHCCELLNKILSNCESLFSINKFLLFWDKWIVLKLNCPAVGVQLSCTFQHGYAFLIIIFLLWLFARKGIGRCLLEMLFTFFCLLVFHEGWKWRKCRQ